MNNICNMTFVEEHSLGYLLKIKLTPNAVFCGFKGVYTDANGSAFLKAYVHAVAEKGKANKELIGLLSKTLKVSKSSFEIVCGQTDHMKRILVKTVRNPQILQEIVMLGEEK